METGEYTWEQLWVQTENGQRVGEVEPHRGLSSYTSVVFIEIDHCDRGENGQKKQCVLIVVNQRHHE